MQKEQKMKNETRCGKAFWELKATGAEKRRFDRRVDALDEAERLYGYEARVMLDNYGEYSKGGVEVVISTEVEYGE